MDIISQDGILYKLSPSNDYYTIQGFEFNATPNQRQRMQRLCLRHELNGKPITKIASEAFKGNLWIESVFIPESIKYIGHQAFAQCQNLTDFSWYGKNTIVVEMGALVFLNCKNLKSVYIQSFLKAGSKDFCKCSNLQRFACAYIDNIPSDYFVGCSSLMSVSFVKCGCLNRSSFMGSAVKNIGFCGDAPKLFDGTVEQWLKDGIQISCLAENPLIDLSYEGVAINVVQF